MVNLISAYLNGFRNYSVLSENEEHELVQSISKGNLAARNKLVMSYIPLVASIINKFFKKYIYSEDVIQSGLLGLVIAAKRVNPAYKCRFHAYASFYIKNEIQEYLRDNSRCVKLPAKNKEVANNPKWFATSLEKIIEKENDSETTIADFIEDTLFLKPDEKYFMEDLHKILLSAVNAVLSNLERSVILDYFGFNGEPLSYSQIGEKLGYSRQGINAIAVRALAKLRSYLQHIYLADDTYCLAA